MTSKSLSFLGACLFSLLSMGCGPDSPEEGETTRLQGTIEIDGSSTVAPISQVMKDHFGREQPNVTINIGTSGTGGGFKKFAAGETDISDASREIKKEEAEACKAKGIEFLEFQVAWDGLTVTIHPDNTWAESLSVAQLKRIWEPNSKVQKWNEIDPKWPAEGIKLFGAGPDSGTFDYFTEAINGKSGASRSDYEASENDDILVKGVSSNKYALGYFGLAYYEVNKGKIKAVAIEGKTKGKAVLPSKQSVMDGSYKPLGRPLFIYVKKASLGRPEVQSYIEFYLRRGDLIGTGKAQYIPLTTRQQYEQQAKFAAALKSLPVR